MVAMTSPPALTSPSCHCACRKAMNAAAILAPSKTSPIANRISFSIGRNFFDLNIVHKKRRRKWTEIRDQEQSGLRSQNIGNTFGSEQTTVSQSSSFLRHSSSELRHFISHPASDVSNQTSRLKHRRRERGRQGQERRIPG